MSHCCVLLCQPLIYWVLVFENARFSKFDKSLVLLDNLINTQEFIPKNRSCTKVVPYTVVQSIQLSNIVGQSDAEVVFQPFYIFF